MTMCWWKDRSCGLESQRQVEEEGCRELAVVGRAGAVEHADVKAVRGGAAGEGEIGLRAAQDQAGIFAGEERAIAGADLEAAAGRRGRADVECDGVAADRSD